MNGDVRDIAFTSDSHYMLSIGSKYLAVTDVIMMSYPMQVKARCMCGTCRPESAYTASWTRAVSRGHALPSLPAAST